jgi:hypothetical protein
MGKSTGHRHHIVSHPTIKVLSGWKEISTYLRSGVRTAQRWETIGLPVRRIGVGSIRPVIAFSEELDAWQKTAPTGFSDVIAGLRAKVCTLEIEVTSLKQQLKNERQRKSVQDQTNTGYRMTANQKSDGPQLLRASPQ